MATTLAQLRGNLEHRLGDPSNSIWEEDQLTGFIAAGIGSLYPSWYRRQVATSEADDGPLQTMPHGARNLYLVGLKRPGSTRVRPLRNWTEGNGEAFVSKTGIEGQTLVWCWTEGFEVPQLDSDILTIPPEAEEPVLIRAHIAALEQLFTNRVLREKYHALQVRQASTEEDIATALDALHTSLREHMEFAMRLPEPNV